MAAFVLEFLGLFCMMTFTTTLAGIYIAAVLLGAGHNLMQSYVMGFILRITPPRLAPVGLSVYRGGSNLGQLVSVYVLNFFAGLLGGGMKDMLLLCTVGMAACGVAAFFVYRIKDAPAQAGQAAEAQGA
jgi:hypothetical protein